MLLLEAKNITLAYDNNIISENINFSVNAGDYLCIIGENGSGKTTLLKSILGLIKIKSGELIISDNLNKTEIGYLPQQKETQKDFPASVMEVVLSGCLNKLGKLPFYTKKHKQLAIDNLNKLNILDLKDSSYANLSGGQKQRVLLARALCATNKLLILDEPITGLDSKTTSDLYELITDLNKNENIAIIMISHDIKQSMKNATKILHLAQEPLFFGTKEDYLKTSLSNVILGGQ